jgi:hypothetical protein
MVKVEIDPLTDVQLILIISKANDFDQIICFLTYSHNRVSFLHLFQVIINDEG